MTKDEIYKLKAATLYILKECGGETDYIHLFKILYFAERAHMAKYGTHLVKDVFCALPKGPVPSFLYDAVKVASGKHLPDPDLTIIAEALTPGEGEGDFWVRAKEEPDMDELSKADIALLDESIKENLPKDYRVLSSESHDSAWKSAWSKRQAEPMDEFQIAKAGGASDGFIEYMKEQETFNNYLRN